MTIITDEPTGGRKAPQDMTTEELREKLGVEDVAIHPVGERLYTDSFEQLVAHTEFVLQKLRQARTEKLGEPGRAIAVGYEAASDRYYLLTIFKVDGVGEVADDVQDDDTERVFVVDGEGEIEVKPAE